MISFGSGAGFEPATFGLGTKGIDSLHCLESFNCLKFNVFCRLRLILNDAFLSQYRTFMLGIALGSFPPDWALACKQS